MWQAGFGKVDVTPPQGVAYLSYQPRQSLFAGVHDRLFARALAVEGGGRRVVLVAVDALGFSRDVLGPSWDFIEACQTRIYALTGIPRNQVVLSATHAHSTPQTTHLAPSEEIPALARWIRALPDLIAMAAWQAVSDLKPAVLSIQQGRVENVSKNRRAELYGGTPPIDASLGVLRVQRDGDFGVLINFACHPVVVQVQPLVSADFPGHACAIIEQQYGARVGLFLQGAAGDVNPVRDTTDFDDVAKYGTILANEVMRVLNEGGREAMGEAVAAGMITCQVPHRRIAPAVHVTDGLDGISQLQAIARLNHLARASEVACSLQAICLGHLLVFAVSGELFSEFGLRLKAAFPKHRVMIAGYANGYIGYIPPSHAYDRAIYETRPGPWNRMVKGGGEQIMVALQALGEQVQASASTPGREPL